MIDETMSPYEKKSGKNARKERFLTLIERKIEDYVQSFTIHGLTRSVTARQYESLFWTAILTLGIVCASVVIHGLITKYYSRAIYTELTSKVTERNNFPSVTFCEQKLLQTAYFAYCDKPLVEHGTCNDSKAYTNNTSFYIRLTNGKNKSTWSNSWFTVTSCNTLGNTECTEPIYYKSRVELNNSCFTWNKNGDFHDPYSQVTIEFKFQHPTYTESNRPVIIALPHDSSVTELDLTKKIRIDSDHLYEMTIDKTIVKRLEHPFPSNCTRRTDNGMFPGRYTPDGCLESYYYKDMYKKCGDVYDYHRKYIPRDIKDKYSQQGNSSANLTKCIYEYSYGQKLENLKHCNFPCEYLDLSFYASFVTRHAETGKNISGSSNNRSVSADGNRKKTVFKYKMEIQMRTPNEYRVMEEKQLYTLSQMACEIGGMVGLIMGMSVISIIEVLVIIALSVCKKYNKLTKACI